MSSVPGPIALVGSGEFLPQSEILDRRLLDGRASRVAIVPTAAGREGDGSIDRWIALGVDHYRRLGAEPVPIRAIDDASADDATLAAAIDGCGLIYFSGGDPTHVTSVMRDSAVWTAVLAAWRAGSALAGCSAGAMMMGSVTASPRRNDLVDGLGLFDDLCVIPHFDRFDQGRPDMAVGLAERVGPATTLLGIDEDTALVIDPASGATEVVGRQRAWHLNPGIGEDRSGWSDGEATDLTLRPSV